MKFFDQNSAPAISGNLANYTFRQSWTCVYLSGAICGFARSADCAAQSADRAAQFVDPHIAQLICGSRNHR